VSKRNNLPTDVIDRFGIAQLPYDLWIDAVSVKRHGLDDSARRLAPSERNEK